jgi:hypothetical protein
LLQKPAVSQMNGSKFPRKGISYGAIGGSFETPCLRIARIDFTEVNMYVEVDAKKISMQMP